MKPAARKTEAEKLDDEHLADALSRQRDDRSFSRFMQIAIAITVGVVTTICGKLVLLAGETRDDVKAALFQVAQGTKEREQLFVGLAKVNDRMEKLQDSVTTAMSEIKTLNSRVTATETQQSAINAQLLDLRERQIKSQEVWIRIESELAARSKQKP